MDGYATFERVVGNVRARPLVDEGPECPHVASELALLVEVGNPGSARLISDRLRDALADVRVIWSQTTFYVFDPDSWR